MIVLDASAVYALLGREPGSEQVTRFLDDSLMSAINLAEVLQKSAQRGMDPAEVRELLRAAEIGIVAFDDEMAAATASLWHVTKHAGLSLADRACLALAQAVDGLAITMDRAWSSVELPGVSIHVIAR